MMLARDLWGMQCVCAHACTGLLFPGPSCVHAMKSYSDVDILWSECSSLTPYITAVPLRDDGGRTNSALQVGWDSEGLSFKYLCCIINPQRACAEGYSSR